MARDIDIIKQALLDQGWVLKNKGGKDMAYPPNKHKQPVLLPSTPGGGRWKQNLISQLRRSGFVWPAPTRKEK